MESKSSSEPIVKSARIILVVAVCLILLSGGYYFYSVEERAITKSKHEEIKAIADLKIGQIVQWRKERISDAQLTSKSTFFANGIGQWLKNKNDKLLKNELINHFQRVNNVNIYEDIFLGSVNGELLLSNNPEEKKLDPIASLKITESVKSGRILFTDFYYCPTHQKIHYDIIAPIIVDNQPIAVLLFRIDPKEYLYPLIQSWPTPSKTSETLLVRKDGDSVLFVNDLRFQKNTALHLRIPLTRKEVPAVQAVLGITGTFEGNDYRNIPVLSYLGPIPGTPWFMVAKIDKSEIFTELRYRAFSIGLITLILIALTGVGFTLAYKARQKNILQELLDKEKELRISQEVFRTTLYSIGDAVITTDVKGAIRQMNPVAEQLTGWQEAEANGMIIDKVFRIISEDTRIVVENPVVRVLIEGLIVGLANHTLLISKNGKETPIADSGAPIKNKTGEISGVVLVFRDQTEERIKIKELIATKENLRAIFENNAAAIAIIEPDTTISMVNQAYCRMSGYSEQEVIGMSWTQQIPPEDLDRLIEYNRKRLTNPDDAPDKYEFRFCQKDGEIRYGLMSVSMIQNPQKIITSFIDITERKLASEALHASEAKYRKLHESMMDGFVFVNMEGQICECNESYQQMLGYSFEELKKLSYNDITPEKWETYEKEIIEDQILIQGYSQIYEKEYQKKDGTIFPVELRTFLIKNEPGENQGMWTIVRDITERKKAEEALIKSEQYFRLLVENAPQPIFIQTENSFSYVNRAIMELYGADNPDQLIGKPVAENIHPDYRDHVKDRIHNLNDNKINVATSEYKHLKLDKTVIEVITTAVPINYENKNGALVFVTDITERKKSEEALQKSEERLRRVYESGLLGVMYWNMNGEIVDANDKFLEIVGYTREDLINGRIDWINMTPPEFRYLDELSVEELKSTGVNKVPFEKEYIHKNGFRIPVTIAGAMLDEERFNGVSYLLDITERKKSEIILKEKMEDFSRMATVVSDSNDAVILHDFDGKIMAWNRGAIETYGYTEAEALGTNVREIVAESDREAALNLIQRIKQGDIVKSFELKRVTKDGRILDVWLTTTLLTDENGKPVAIATTERDITWRKKDELELLIAKEAAEISEVYINNIINNMGDPVFVKDDQSRLLLVNDAFCNIFELSRNDIIGKTLAEDVTPYEREQFLKIDNQVLTDGQDNITEELLTVRGGRTRTISTRKTRFIDNNDNKYLIGAIRDITERIQIENALKKSEQKYQSLFNEMTEGFAVHEIICNDEGVPIDYRFLMINPSFEKLTGLKSELAVGKTVLEVMPGIEPFWIETYGKVALTGESVVFENYSKELDRSFRVIAFSHQKGQFATLFEDITDRKLAETNLVESERKFRETVVNLDEGYYSVTLEGELLDHNQAFSHMLGFPGDQDIRGYKLPEFWQNPDERKTYLDAFSATGSISNYQINIKTQHGEKVMVLASSHQVKDKENHPVRIEGVFLDITDRLRAEEKIKNINEELEQRVLERTAQLEVSNKELEAFSYSVSHDLRAPLRHIGGYVELLNKHFPDSLPDKGKHYLKTIVDSVGQMGMLIDDLLRFSRTGRQELRLSNIDMNEVVRDVLFSIGPDCKERNIQWITPELPLALGDFNLMKMVWSNLISNAVKFTRKKDIAVIEIGFKEDNKEFIFYVRDNGVGFDMHFVHKLFGVFQRLHSSSEYEGTGIGLANVQRIVIRHGGRVWAESEQDNGATFYFTLLKNKEEKS